MDHELRVSADPDRMTQLLMIFIDNAIDHSPAGGTVRLFVRIGKGTLAPWDPPRRLVVEGPYGYVRNPMITAVLAVLLGEAALFGSPGLLVWFALFIAINFAFFVLYEEPSLERKFGEEYREYKRRVPRWVPRRMPWQSAPR